MGGIVDKINKEIYREYSFYKGVKPKVSTLSNGDMLLVYEKSEKTADGFSIPMQLRVKADAEGKIKSVSGTK